MSKLAFFSKFSLNGTLFMKTRDQRGKIEKLCHEALPPKSQENEEVLVEFW